MSPVVAYSLILISAFAGPLNALSVTPQETKKIEIFDISQEPNPADWQRFNRFTPARRQGLWRYFASQGKTLKNWSWGWRIGWVRTCTKDLSPYCQKMLEDGLGDNALVVRAEAATSLGKRFEGTKNKTALNLLENAYQDKRNYRNGDPLFAQNRILEAIKLIGGEAAMKTGSKLAATNPNAKLYWQKLNRL